MSRNGNAQRPKEAKSWDVVECEECGAPVLLLTDATGNYFGQVHLDGDSLDDLIAVLVDLSGDADESDLPEGAILQ